MQKNAIEGMHASGEPVGDRVDYQTPLLAVRLIIGFSDTPGAYAKLPPDLSALLDCLGGTECAVRYVSAY